MTNVHEQIMSSPEGGTLAQNGSELPTTGYFVGGLVSPLIVDQDVTRDDVNAFIAYLGLNQDTIGYIGWWTDEETGKLWVDGTSWHADYDEAERVTRDRGEIAFYSIADQREFRPVVTE